MDTGGSPNDQSRRKILYLCLFLMAIALASLAGLVGPKISWMLREGSERSVLEEEARRFGGSAVVREGEYGFMSETVSISVDLDNSTITDDSFAKFCTLPAFRRVVSVRLEATRITDKGVDSLKGGVVLAGVDLSKTAITDASFEILASIPRLQVLRLSGTKITDAGLETLGKRCSPTSRMELDVTDTAVTEEGVRKLHEVLKQWVISYGSSKSPRATNN